MTAAKAISEALEASTDSAQAESVGARREHWNRYRRGILRPTVATLEAWADSANLTLRYTPGQGWTASPK